MKVSSHGFWRSSTRCSRSHCRWDTIICSAGGDPCGNCDHRCDMKKKILQYMVS